MSEEHEKKLEEEHKQQNEHKEEKQHHQSKDKDDEEIAIDLSKVKNIFSRKKKKQKHKETKHHNTKKEKHHTHSHKEHKEAHQTYKKEEYRKEKEIKEIKQDDEQIKFDIKGTWRATLDFFRKYGIVLLILIPIFFSIWFRMYPAYLPVTDQWATNSVHNFYRNQIVSSINQQYPNLPDANKQALINSEFAKFLKENKATVEQQLKANSQHFKSQFQDDTGQTYLLAIDPYFYLRNVENYLDHGFDADKEVNGCRVDTHAGAPFIDEGQICEGKKKKFGHFHIWFETFWYKFWHFFSPSTSPMKAVFYVPVFISLLAVIPAFFIARKIGGNLAGFFSGMVIAIHTSFITRTPAGFADTDAWNVTLPLFVVWFFIEMFYSRTTKQKIIYGALGAFFLGVFSWAWGGWSYIFTIILAAFIGYIIYYLIYHRKNLKEQIFKKSEFKQRIIYFIFFLILSGIFVSLFTSFTNFFHAIFNVIGFSKMKEVAATTIWPNVFTTVAELNPASLNQIVSQGGMGSKLLFLLGLIGIIFAMIYLKNKKGKQFSKTNKTFLIISIIWYIIIIWIQPHISSIKVFLILLLIPIVIGFLIPIFKKQEEINIFYGLFLIIWFVATIYASTKGVRFLLILVPVFAIAFGITIGCIYKILSNWISKELKINKIIVSIIIIILLLLLLMTPMKTAKANGHGQIPSMNDAWVQTLTKIKQESKPDAIINSWWDFGHWFKYWADRGVTLDGGIQNQPQAHWLGKLMLTDDENLSIAILRMLSCGANRAFQRTEKYSEGNSYKAIQDLYTILEFKDKKKAKQVLLDRGYEENEVNEILKFSHCDAPEDYFITSQDMIGKSGVWAHFGSWDFTKSAMYNQINKKTLEEGKKILMKDFDLTEEQAENLYYEIQTIDPNQWISGWPSYVTGTSGCRVEQDKILCTVGLQNQVLEFEINKHTYDTVIRNSQQKARPNSIVYQTHDTTVEKKFNESTIGYSLILIGKDNSYQAVISHPLLANSIFTRLFYMNGHGLKQFDMFHNVMDVTGAKISTWKVDWDGKTKDEWLELYPKEIETEDLIEDENNIEKDIKKEIEQEKKSSDKKENNTE